MSLNQPATICIHRLSAHNVPLHVLTHISNGGQVVSKLQDWMFDRSACVVLSASDF